MKLNESFVKRLMTLAGNADYSSRFITEAKKKTAKKEKGGYGKKHSKKEEVEEELMEAEGEDDERELLSDEGEFEMEDEDEGEGLEDEGPEYEDEEDEGMEDEDEDSLSGVEDEFDVDSVGDELEDEDEDFDSEEGGTEVTVDAKELVAAVTNALASVLGSNVVSMESANDNEMDMESDDEMDMEETPKPVGESRRVTSNISRAIAESVFDKLVARGIFEAKEPMSRRKLRDITPEEAERIDRLQREPLTIDSFEEMLGRMGMRKKGYTFNRDSGKYEKKDTSSTKRAASTKKPGKKDTSSTKRAASNKKPVEDSYRMKQIKGTMPGSEED